MIKIYDIVQHKTNIKGFWLDNGKIYRDNIYIRQALSLNRRIKYHLFDYKKQIAIFYMQDNKAFILDNKGNKTILSHCIRYIENHITKKYIEALLIQHKGLTIYRKKGYYTIEIWRE